MHWSFTSWKNTRWSCRLISSDEKPPEIKPDFAPPPHLTTEEIFDETSKKHEGFIKTSLALRDEELKAENDIAQQQQQQQN